MCVCVCVCVCVCPVVILSGLSSFSLNITSLFANKVCVCVCVCVCYFSLNITSLFANKVLFKVEGEGRGIVQGGVVWWGGVGCGVVWCG